MTAVKAAIVGGAIVLLALAGVGAYALIFGRTPGPIPLLTPTCTIAYGGTDVNVTVQGSRADAACDSLIASSKSTQGYRTSRAGQVVCERDLNGLHYTVREIGPDTQMGSRSCEELYQQSP